VKGWAQYFNTDDIMHTLGWLILSLIDRKSEFVIKYVVNIFLWIQLLYMYIHLCNNYFTLIKVKKTIGYNILQLLTKTNSIGSLVERQGLKIVTFDK